MTLAPLYNGAFTIAQARDAAGLLASALDAALKARSFDEEEREEFGSSFGLSDGNKVMRLYVKRLNMTVVAESYDEDEPPTPARITKLANHAVELVS